MWNERYPAQTGSVWQYFPTEDLTAQYGQNLVPMVVELAPELEASGLSIQWTAADDSGVAMPQGLCFSVVQHGPSLCDRLFSVAYKKH